jgi:prevent-host-death family protein
MKDVGMFEAKTKLSELCDAVYRTGESVLVTKRGKPYVRIVPLEEPESTGSSIWEARERYESEYGTGDIPDFPAVHREREPVFDPFDQDRSE